MQHRKRTNNMKGTMAILRVDLSIKYSWYKGIILYCCDTFIYKLWNCYDYRSIIGKNGISLLNDWLYFNQQNKSILSIGIYLLNIFNHFLFIIFL